MSTFLLSTAAFLTVFLAVWLVGAKRAASKAMTSPLSVPLPEDVTEKGFRALAAVTGCLLWTIPGAIAGFAVAGGVWRWLG